MVINSRITGVSTGTHDLPPGKIVRRYRGNMPGAMGMGGGVEPFLS